VWLVVGYMATLAIDAPLRFYLNNLGIGEVIYIRDIGLLFYSGILLIANMYYNFRLSKVAISAAIIVIIYLAIGLLFGAHLSAVLLSGKIYFILICGIVIGRNGIELSKAKLPILLIWIVLTTSIVAQASGVDFPWIGLSYDTMFGEVEASKFWWVGDEIRLAGTARASYSAAMLIGVISLLLCSLYSSKLIKAAVCFFSLLTVYQTTTKGMFLALIIVYPVLILITTKQLHRHGVATLIVFLAFVASGLPLLSILFEVKGQLPASYPNFLLSLWDRMTWMWPRALEEVEGVSYIIGKGVGSIGVGHNRYDGSENYGDNVFIYQYVVFGLLSIPIVFFVTRRVFVSWASKRSPAWHIGFLIILFSFGITANMIEDAFFSLMLGLVFGASSRTHSDRKSTNQYAW
jgi:hypothetical protein